MKSVHVRSQHERSARAAGQPSPPCLPDGSVQPQRRLCRDDGELVVPVVVYQVDHTVKCPVSSPERINDKGEEENVVIFLT